MNDRNIRINMNVRKKLGQLKVKLSNEKGTYFTYSDAIMYLMEHQG